MLKYYLYLGLSSLSILAILLSNGNPEIMAILSMLFFISHILITFRLIRVREEMDLNYVETSVRYIKRESSLNWENVARGILLIVGGWSFINLPHLWSWILLILWLLGITTVAIPLYRLRKQDIHELILKGLKLQLPELTEDQLVELIVQATAIPFKELSDVKLTGEVNTELKERFVDEYLKLMCETGL